MEAKDEDKKDMEMAMTSYEDHNHHLETYNMKLLGQIDELEQDVAMANSSKEENARIQTAMIALLEKDRDNKHKIVDEALIAVTNNDRDVIVKLQAGMEETGKKIQKDIQSLHQEALDDKQNLQQWEALNRPCRPCKGTKGASSSNAKMNGHNTKHPQQGQSLKHI